MTPPAGLPERGRPLILSVFPGVDLLGMAFEEEWPGACIVRGPDLIFGGDVRSFHPPAGVFDGVIGGPPCQAFSPLANINRSRYGEASIAPNLIPEYERVVGEAAPAWFVMENVRNAPEPVVDGYIVRSVVLNNRMFGAAQNRERRFSFGTPGGLRLSAQAIAESIGALAGEWEPAVTATAGGRRATPKTYGTRAAPLMLPNRTPEEQAELQGLPTGFLSNAPFTAGGKRQAIANGVPLPMGRAVARAVRRALEASR